MVNKATLIKLLEEVAKVLKENRSYLTDLDQAIGDGDHGINLDRGFTAVQESLEALSAKDCGGILSGVAMTLISKVGGASGPLYGTAFMKAGQAVAGKEAIDVEDAIKMFDSAIQGIVARGKAEKGDKTMLDVWIPAYEAFKGAIEGGKTPKEAAEEMLKAAKEGLEFTSTVAARKGRANYLGDRSIGHKDPGAASSYLIFETIVNTLNA